MLANGSTLQGDVFMRMIAVDDEELAVNNLRKLLIRLEPEAEIISFTEPEDAFDYLAENKVDIVFLDIEMGPFTGIALAKRCKDFCPYINIIFVTGYSEYMLDAFRLHASGYLLKPVRIDDLRTELDNLRHPVLLETKRRVRIQTFGNFEVFVDGRLLGLNAMKAKECLAYLIDRRGARVSYRELSAILWEDRPYDRATQNNLHQVIFNLKGALKKQGVEDIVIRTRKEIAVDTEKVDCDYYAAISGDVRWLNTFTGEYMSQYSWAEFTLGELYRRL